MSLSDLASIGSLVSGTAVLVSLIFVGFQLRQNTMQLRRSEVNSTMEQASAWRSAIVGDHAVADVWLKGLSETSTLDDADEARFRLLLEEAFWLMFNIWDRTNRGLLEKDHWSTGRHFLAEILIPRRSAAWWKSYKTKVPPEFVHDIDEVIGAQRPGTAL